MGEAIYTENHSVRQRPIQTSKGAPVVVDAVIW